MAASAVFETACEALEAGSGLERIEARGTVRIALSKAGLDPKTVCAREMSVVLEKVLPAELESRAITDPADVCRRIARALEAAGTEAETRRPEDVFDALAR